MVTEVFDPLTILLEEPDPELRSRAFIALGHEARREERECEAIRYFQRAVEVHPQARAAWRELQALDVKPSVIPPQANDSSILRKLVQSVRGR